MKSELENEELFKRFVLGDLPEPVRVELEDRFLAHDDVYEDLLIAEDDLIDAYVRAELPAPERALFEQRCLSLEHLRGRVEFAQSLFKSVSGQTAAESARAPRPSMSWWRSLARALTTQRPVLGFAFAAVLLVIVLGGWWLFTDKRRSHPEPEQAKAIQPTPVTALESPAVVPPAAEPQRARNEERTPVRETRKGPAPVIATFTLGPGLVRDGNGPGALVLPAAATEVRLRLTLEGEDYKKYRAALSTPEGRAVWSTEVTNGPSMKSTHLNVSIPADLLKNGDYVLDLSGAKADGKWESVADYSFRIVKK